MDSLFSLRKELEMCQKECDRAIKFELEAQEKLEKLRFWANRLFQETKNCPNISKETQVGLELALDKDSSQP